ncbi:RNase adapter RapZ, partial [Pseudomonas syringae group genomosp. 7]
MSIGSGRSGAGKSTAGDVREDSGVFCVANLAAGLVPEVGGRGLINTGL